jgi:hypothetical protein
MKRRRIRHPDYRNPVAAAILRAGIRRQVLELKTAADLQAWDGANAARLVNSAGRMVFVVAHAATACGVGADEPDSRIVRGMAEAVGDLAADGDMERHRPAIQAGLLAIDRLLPRCNDWALGLGAQELERLLASTAGMGTADIHAIFYPQQETTP